MTQKNTNIKTIHISEYLYMLVKHKFLIIICLIVCFGASLGIVKITPLGYETTAKLTIKPVKQKSSLITEGNTDSLFYHELDVKTHLELIRSRPVIEKLIDKLQLNSMQRDEKQEIVTAGLNPEYFRSLIRQVKGNLRLMAGKAKVQKSPAKLREQLVNSLKGSIELRNIRYTTILNVIVRGSDPEKIRNIANTLIETYIQFDINNNQQVSSSSFKFLSNQAVEYKEKLEDAEKEFLEYKQKENLFSITGIQEGLTARMNEYDMLAVTNRNKLQQITIRLKELELLSKDKKLNTSRLRSLIDNPIIDNLNEQIISQQIEYSKLRKVYRSKHAKVSMVQSSLNDLRRELARQVAREISNMKQVKKLLLVEETNLRRNIEDLKKNALNISSKDQQYSILERNVEAYRSYYNTLMAKLEDASVNADIRSAATSISFVERAQTPLYPVKPDKRKILLAGLFGGLFAGIGLAFLIEFSDRTVRTEEDIQHYFDLVVLGVIPQADQGGDSYGYMSKSSRRKENINETV